MLFLHIYHNAENTSFVQEHVILNKKKQKKKLLNSVQLCFKFVCHYL